MKTKFLKFDSEAHAKEVMVTYVHEHNWLTASHTHALDPVGVIHKSTGETIETEDGSQPVYAPLPGYHINFIGDAAEFSQYEVFPATPNRVFG